MTIKWEDFEKIDIRVGTIIEASPFPEAKKAAYKLKIDFGESLGSRKSSAQITELYSCQELIGKKILAVINFPAKQIGSFISECLVLGAYASGGVVLASIAGEASNGDKIA